MDEFDRSSAVGRVADAQLSDAANPYLVRTEHAQNERIYATWAMLSVHSHCGDVDAALNLWHTALAADLIVASTFADCLACAERTPRARL